MGVMSDVLVGDVGVMCWWVMVGVMSDVLVGDVGVMCWWVMVGVMSDVSPTCTANQPLLQH